MSFKLLLVIISVACFGRKFYSQAWECVDSGQEVNGVKIYTPKHCVPTTCKVTTSSGAAVGGFNCAIGNTDTNPTACRDFENALVTAYSEENGTHAQRFLSDVCQATLASIGLYDFSCKEVPLVSVSLALAVDLPTCGRTFSGPQDAVMAEFYSRNKTVDEFYSLNKVCRVFSFGNNDLSGFSPDDSIQVSYDCMGLGLQEEYHKALYYLSLTTYPWEAVLNYTIAYLAKVSEGSMRLIAAAWRSTRRIHVVFETRVGVTAYHVQAKGNNFSFSKIVSSSSPSVEIEDIPPQARIVTVTVRPVEWKHGECPPYQKPCSPIEVTLHDSHQLNLPVEPPRLKGKDDQFRMKVAAVVGTCGAVVMIVIVLFFIGIRRKQQIQGEKGCDSGKQQKMMTVNIAPGNPQTGRILEELQKQGFIITEVFQNPEQFSPENAPKPGMFQDQDVILLFIGPSAQDLQNWTIIVDLIRAIFRMSLVKKTKVVFLADKNGNSVKPSEMFSECLIHFDAVKRKTFLESLDGATFYMPQDWNKLMRCSKGWSKQTNGLGVCVGYDIENGILFGEEAGMKLIRPPSEAGDSDSDNEHWQDDVIEAQVHQPCDRQSGPSLPQARCPGHSSVDARAGVEAGRQQEVQNMPSDPWVDRHPQEHCSSESSPLLRPTPRSVDGPPHGCVGTPRPRPDPSDTEVKRPVSPALSDCLGHSLSAQLNSDTEVKRPVSPALSDCLDHSFSVQLHDETEVKRPAGQRSDHSMSRTLFPEFCGDAEVGQLSGVHTDDTSPSCDDTKEKQCIRGVCAASLGQMMSPHHGDDTKVKHCTDQLPDDTVTSPEFTRCHSDSDQDDLSALFSNILAAPSLSQLSALSVENRPIPDGCENENCRESANDRQGDSVQDQDHSEETTVKTPVPVESMQRTRSSLTEERDRAQLHQSSLQNLPGVIHLSASSRSQSELNYQQSSWPPQSRLVAEGQSFPQDSLDHQPEGENHSSVCEPCPTEQSFDQSDQCGLDPSPDRGDGNESNARYVPGCESWNQERAFNGAAAVETVGPEHWPERWSQRIQNDHTRTLLARTGGSMGGQPDPRLSCDTERPWILPERQRNPAFESVENFAEMLFDDGVLEGAENGRLEQRGDPPGFRISEDSNSVPQIAGPLNSYGDSEELWGWPGGLQPVPEPVEDTESSSESNCLDSENSEEGSVRCGDLEGGQAGPELQLDLGLGGDVHREPVEDSESSSESNWSGAEDDRDGSRKQ